MIKYLWLLLISLAVFGQALDKLEQSYLSKAEKLQDDHDTRARANDLKLATDSKRLAESYLTALRSMLKRETQNGDFDKAVAVKAKIVEIEALMNIRVVPMPRAISKVDPIIGAWKWERQIVTFYKNGTYKGSAQHSIGKWIKINEISYKQTNTITKGYSIIKASKDGNTLSVTHQGRIFNVTRISTLDDFIGTWLLIFKNGHERILIIDQTGVIQKGYGKINHKFSGKILIVQHSLPKYNKWDHLNFTNMSGRHIHTGVNMAITIRKIK